MVKKDFLELLSDGRWWTAPQVAEATGLELSYASHTLRRLHIQGLLRREKVRTLYNPPRLYRYQISQKGLERLEYLTSSENLAGEELASRMGLPTGQKTRAFVKWLTERLGG